MPIAELSDVSRFFDGKAAVRSVSFSAERGEILAIIGPSGSGKTTLMRLMNLLDRPSSGEVLFDGQPTGGLSERELVSLRRQMAMVFQNPTMLNRSVFDNVAFGLRIRGVNEAEVQRGVVNSLGQVGLSELSQRKAQTLSGGEAQRVALARALAVKPKLLLLDEPTANLDPANVAVIEGIVEQLSRDKSICVVMSTHNLFQAERLADRVGVLLEGEIVELDDKDKIFGNPRDRRTAAFIKGEMVY